MAGIILNLASLKSKADTAGVANTANNTTPNLCPPKSTIAGYVTNGATTVVISGTWANNQLVEDASVVVNKYVTGTETVYRNVNVGSLQGGSDIPAAGGSSYAYKTVTYEYATKTYYSDGTSTIGSYRSGSATVTGSTVTASSLGTTAKARTKVGTSSKTQTVAGTSVSVSGTVYQAANVKTTETLYRNVNVGDSDADYIPASGGQKRAYAYVSYEQATKTSYTSGSTSTGAYSSAGKYIYGEYVSATDLGKTIKKVTSIGTSTPSGWAAGANRTSNQVTVYQAANYITAIQATTSEGTDYHVRYNNIGAAGGSSSPQGTGRCKYTFKSGYTETNSYTTPFDNVTASYSRTYSEYSDSSGAFSVNSNGVVSVGSNSGSSRSVTVKSTLTVSISYASAYSSLSKPSSSSITHYPTCTQSGNSVTVDYYELRMRANSVDMIPSAGGTSGAISIDWVKFTTYYKNSDGTSAGNDGGVIVTSSINSTKYYGLASGYPGGTSTTYWSNQPSSWSTSSSSAKKTISAINTSTSDISSFNGTTYYAAMKVSYSYGGNTYYAWDSSIIKQAGKKSLGDHLTISVNSISDIPYSGGYSSAITLASAWFSKEYDNGQSSGFDATSSVSKYYGKKTGSTAPTDSEMEAVTSTDSSSSVMHTGSTTGSGGIIGYAIMKCFCNGQFAWAYAQVNQSAYTAPTTGFYMYITPARYNSTYMTSPAFNLILSNGTAVSGHSRQNYVTTQYKTWNSSGTVSKFSLSENNIQINDSRVNYISIYTVVNGTTKYYANKLYIGGSQAGTYNLTTTFHTSDFNNGSKYLYITYYFS